MYEFVEQLLHDCQTYYDEFRKSVKYLQEHNPQITQRIAALGNRLYLEQGFTSPADTVEFTSVWHPISFTPVDVGEL